MTIWGSLLPVYSPTRLNSEGAALFSRYIYYVLLTHIIAGVTTFIEYLSSDHKTVGTARP